MLRISKPAQISSPPLDISYVISLLVFDPEIMMGTNLVGALSTFHFNINILILFEDKIRVSLKFS